MKPLLNNIRKLLILLLLFYSMGSALFAQKKKLEWFPENPIYPNLKYDLLENQVYTGIFFLNSDQKMNKSVYVPVNFGLNKNFLQWRWGQIDLALGLGAASYTQFEIELYDSNTLRGGLLNTDFRASGMLYAKKGNHHLRLHIFHRSSHLGDDYMLRNEDFRLNDKSLSYEQIDLIYFYRLQYIGLYLGLAEVISPYVFRERFMIQGGVQGQNNIWGSTDFVYGTDIKVYEENHYQPDIHAGLGLQFNKNQNPQLLIMIDSYYGHLPYSTLEYGKIFWAGLSASVYLR